MITYNHERFIAQAIESVLMQKTDFAVELVIGEDCSTDGTREIVRRYAANHSETIRLLLPDRNIGMHQNMRLTLSGCRGEYIALLEGDDYWAFPHKLQRQVEFLDTHPECVMGCHRVRVFDEEQQHGSFEEPPAEYRFKIHTVETLLRWNTVVTCSAMIRRAAIPKLPEEFLRLRLADWPLWILLGRQGDIGYQDELLAHHRIHSGGIWSSMADHEHHEAAAQMYAVVANYLPPDLKKTAYRRSKQKSQRARRSKCIQELQHAGSQPRPLLGQTLLRVITHDPLIVFWRPFVSAIDSMLFGGRLKAHWKHFATKQSD